MMLDRSATVADPKILRHALNARDGVNPNLG